MSNLQHIAAIIRVDSIEECDFTHVFGRELHYDSTLFEWDNARLHPEQYLPYGSDGSLTMSVWHNPDHNSIAAYTISIFGDLRDPDKTPRDILKWFKSKCDKLWIRNAVITVQDEVFGTETYCYGEKTKWS